MSDLYPEGLTQKELDALAKCTKEVANFPPERLLDQAKGYLKRLRMLHAKYLHINVGLAEAIVRTFEDIFNDWENIPPHARSWCRGMVQYFCVSDDTEIMNACLRLAGREDLCINPEDFYDG